MHVAKASMEAKQNVLAAMLGTAVSQAMPARGLVSLLAWCFGVSGGRGGYNLSGMVFGALAVLGGTCS